MYVISIQEVLMYLSNSVRDFESLIKTIELEVAWDEKSSRCAFFTIYIFSIRKFMFDDLLTIMICKFLYSSYRRHAVAWEIRKAISPSGKPIVEGPNKDADTLINMLKL